VRVLPDIQRRIQSERTAAADQDADTDDRSDPQGPH